MSTNEMRPAVSGAHSTTGEVETKVPQAADIPHVTGVVYAPHARRHRYLVLVECCPRCHDAHEHYTDRVGRYLRRGCLVTGQPYYVFPRVRRTVRRAA